MSTTTTTSGNKQKTNGDVAADYHSHTFFWLIWQLSYFLQSSAAVFHRPREKQTTVLTLFAHLSSLCVCVCVVFILVVAVVVSGNTLFAFAAGQLWVSVSHSLNFRVQEWKEKEV